MQDMPNTCFIIKHAGINAIKLNT